MMRFVAILRMGIHISIALFAVGVGAGSTGAGAADFWRVSEEQARCLLDNKDAYLAGEGSPLVIVLSACPEADVVKAMQLASRNSALPANNKGGSDYDDIIVYSREELRCLTGQMMVITGAEVKLPSRPTC